MWQFGGRTRACERLNWSPDTLVCGVSILDRVLHCVRVRPKYLPPVAAAALLLAGKLNEEDECVPAIWDVVSIGEMECSPRELLRMELILLDKLQWKLSCVSSLHFLQVLHALVVVTQPKTSICPPETFTRTVSPSRELEVLTTQMTKLVCDGRSCQMRPSLLSLALLTLQLHANHSQEPGLVLWLQALTKIGDSELLWGQDLVLEILGKDAPVPLAPSPVYSTAIRFKSQKRTVGRPSKRKVEEGQQYDDDLYSDIKKLYSTEKKKKRGLHKATAPKELNKPKTGFIDASKKIHTKLSIIASKAIFEENQDEKDPEEEYEDEEEEMEDGKPESIEGVVEEMDQLQSPAFFPMSPEFPNICHLTEAGQDQQYRPMTYAQVLRLHLTPLTTAWALTS
ncbi:LOW QUALITY PROTEIN: cyclin-I-like [Oratosquilla oratoria]|uniref:LOW QUALITY PROTEIN: cyclin-I-like n=1 Tax=Oratosquilla oratoria TaxID=337810 RepID=UPI003F75E2CD